MKTNVVGTVGLSLALVALDVSPALAQETSRRHMDARTAVQQVGMDRETALSVRNRNTIAWIGLIAGTTVGASLATIGSSIMTSGEEDCNKMQEATHEKADCIRNSAEAGKTWIYAGGASLAVGVLAFVIIRPGATARAESDRVLAMPDVRVQVDPKSRAGYASALFRF